MTTIRTLVTDALIDLGRFDPTETPDDANLNHGLRVLNRMIGEWAIENLLVPYTTSENFATVAGTANYTMGAAGTASATRANMIQSAVVLDGTLVSPIDVIDQRRYNNITDKTLTGKPDRLFYDPVYPVGTIYLYKTPDAAYMVYIESTGVLHAAMAIGDTFGLPLHYENAVVLNLRNALCKPHGVQKTADMILEADEAKRKIKNINLANRLEEMDMPAGSGGEIKPMSINEG